MLAAKFEDKRTVVDVYTRKASYYDMWGTLTESHARVCALERAHIQNGETIL